MAFISEKKDLFNFRQRFSLSKRQRDLILRVMDSEAGVGMDKNKSSEMGVLGLAEGVR